MPEIKGLKRLTHVEALRPAFITISGQPPRPLGQQWQVIERPWYANTKALLKSLAFWTALLVISTLLLVAVEVF